MLFDLLKKHNFKWYWAAKSLLKFKRMCENIYCIYYSISLADYSFLLWYWFLEGCGEVVQRFCRLSFDKRMRYSRQIYMHFIVFSCYKFFHCFHLFYFNLLSMRMLLNHFVKDPLQPSEMRWMLWIVLNINLMKNMNPVPFDDFSEKDVFVNINW